MLYRVEETSAGYRVNKAQPLSDGLSYLYSSGKLGPLEGQGWEPSLELALAAVLKRIRKRHWLEIEKLLGDVSASTEVAEETALAIRFVRLVSGLESWRD